MMKYKWIIFSFFVMVMFLRGEVIAGKNYEIGLEDAIEMVKRKGDIVRINKIESNQIKLEKKGEFIDKWLKLDFEIKPENIYYKKESDTKKTYFNLSYRSFYFNSTYENKDEKLKRNFSNIGYTKELNDFFYSDEEYKKNMLLLKERNTKNDYKSNKIQELENLIDQYLVVKNLEISIRTKLIQIKENEEIIKILKEKLNLGEGTQLKIEYFKIENTSLKNELGYLNKLIESKKKKLCNILKLEYEKTIKFKEIERVNIDKIKILNYEVEKKEMEIETVKEEIKYYKRQNQWIVSLGTDYDLENEDWITNLFFKGSVINFNSQKHIKKEELKKLKIELERVIKENSIKKIQKKDEYENLINNYNLWKSKKKNGDKKYKIIKKLYTNGYIGFKEYLEERKKFLEIGLDFEKSKNELSVFEWKLKLIK